MSTLIITPQVSELVISADTKCPHCSTLFGSWGARQMHLVKRHNIQSDFLKKKTDGVLVKYHCPVEKCKYRATEDGSTRFFTTLKYVKQHYFKSHAPKTFSCKTCDKSFSTAQFLENHVKKECRVSFVCVQCSLVYKTREALVTHCRRKMHFMSQNSEKDPGSDGVKKRMIYPRPTTTVTASPIRPLSTHQVSGDLSIEAIAATALSELSWKVVVKRGVETGTQTTRSGGGGGLTGWSKRSITASAGQTRKEAENGRRPRKARKDILTQTAGNDLSTSGTQTTLKPLLDPSLTNGQQLHHIVTQHHHQQQAPQHVVAHTSAFTDDDFPQFFSSATQTNTELDFDLNMFSDIDQYVNNETQTELINQQNTEVQQQHQQGQEQQTWGSLDEDDCPALLDSHTQTVDPDEYSHNCTQTCNDILLNDFVELTDIETQTAWASLGIDSSLTTAETQTLL